MTLLGDFIWKSKNEKMEKVEFLKINLYYKIAHSFVAWVFIFDSITIYACVQDICSF